MDGCARDTPPSGGACVPESSSTSQQPPRLTSAHAQVLRVAVPQRSARSAAFAEYAQWWLDEQRRAAQAGLLRPNTIRRFESALRAYLLPFFGAYQLDELSRSHCKGFRREAVRAGGLTPRSVNSINAILRLVLRRAVDDGILTTIPPAACAASERCPTNPAATQCAKSKADHRAARPVAGARRRRRLRRAAPRRSPRPRPERRLRPLQITITRSLQHPHPQFSVKQRLGPPKSPSAIRSVPIRPHLAALLEPHLADHVEPNQWQLLFSRNARPVLPIWFHTSV